MGWGSLGGIRKCKCKLALFFSSRSAARGQRFAACEVPPPIPLSFDPSPKGPPPMEGSSYARERRGGNLPPRRLPPPLIPLSFDPSPKGPPPMEGSSYARERPGGNLPPRRLPPPLIPLSFDPSPKGPPPMEGSSYARERGGRAGTPPLYTQWTRSEGGGPLLGTEGGPFPPTAER